MASRADTARKAPPLGPPVAAAAQRSTEAWREFEQLVHESHCELRRFAYRFVGTASDADDVLQDAYLKAFRAYDRFRDNGERSRTAWLFRIVHRCCLDELRRRRRRSLLGSLFPSFPREQAGPEVVVVARLELLAALARLSDDARAAMLLVDGAGVDYATAAKVLDVPEGTVASRLSAARASLRAALDETGLEEA